MERCFAFLGEVHTWVSTMTRQCTVYIQTQLPSVPQSLIKCSLFLFSSVTDAHSARTAQENDSRHMELQAGIARWELNVSRNGSKFKNKLDDEIKLAGLWALVLAELEKHLILNSHRLLTFEDARLEIVKDVEAKFGFRDSKPTDTVSRGHSVPWVLMRSIFFTRWLFQVRWSTCSTRLQCTTRQRQAIIWQRQTEQVKGKSKENKGKTHR